MLDRLDLRVGGRMFPLERDIARLAVTYVPTLARSDRFSVERDLLGRTALMRFEVPDFAITVIDIESDMSSDGFEPPKAATRFSAAPEVSSARPVFKLGDKRVILTSFLSVGFASDTTDAQSLAARSGLNLSASEAGFATFMIPEDDDVSEWVEVVSQLPGVRFAEPDLLTVGSRDRPMLSGIRPLSMPPEELQKAFQNVSTAEAWAATDVPGSIRIAILDDGVDLKHPALAPYLVGSYDAITQRADGTANPWDYHGTACAGIIGAQSDAPPFRGIASGVSLLGVRIAQSQARGLPWVTSNSMIRRGIDWAINNSADILSCSWGGPPSAAVIEAVQRGRSQGRDRKGAVFVFAAGNSGGPVEFPATLKGVVAVSAVNLQDEPKTHSSSDGETRWATNNGPEIDIAAPGIQIRTSDTAGPEGRTRTDWRDDFNGTSAACPIVAAAAGLIMAHSPDMTSDAIIECLLDGAEKVPTISWDGKDRDDQLGRGRLNIATSLHLSRESQTVRGFVEVIKISQNVQIYRVGDALFLAHQNDIAALDSAIADRMGVTLRFEAARETQIGRILDQARLLEEPAAPRPPPINGDQPPAGEVRLPRPEDDIFAGVATVSGGATRPSGVTTHGPPQLTPEDLTNIRGIGAARARFLRNAGIRTLGDLLRLDDFSPMKRALALGSLAATAEREKWFAQARSLLSGDQTTEEANANDSSDARSY